MSTTATLATLMATTLLMPVAKNETKNGKTTRVEVGTVEVFSPSLLAFGIQSEPTGLNEATGELTYASQQDQWAYNAIVAGVKANARNRLVAGSTALRPGAKLPTTLEELVTPAENTSTVLADRRALFDMFKNFLSTQGKSEAVNRLLVGFIEKPDLLALQPEDKRAKIKPYFEDFGNSVAERLNDWQGEYLMNVIEQCDAAEVEF